MGGTVAVGIFALAAAVAEEPRFARGDAAQLAARVVATEAITKESPGCVVEVEVTNRSALFAEPLVFRFVPRAGRDEAGAIVVPRVDFPHHGRAGAAVAPGGERRYPLLVPLSADDAKGCAVRVERASFADSALELEDPVAIGRLTGSKEFRAERQKTVEVTRVTLENRTPYALDAVVRAEYRGPKRAETLLRYRLQPEERREVAIEELPVGGGASWSGAEVSRLELADVSAVVDAGEEEAARLFREAYEAWLALPAETPALGARYELAQTIGGQSLAASGELVVRPDGTVELAPDEPGDDMALGAARSALTDALAFIRRPSAEEVLRATRIALIAWGETSVVRLDRAAFQHGQKDLHLWIRDGRIVGEALSPEWPSMPWTLRDEGAGYVVTAKEQRTTFQSVPQNATRLGYARVGELVLPTSWSAEFTLESYPDSAKRVQLTLTDWTVGVDPDALGTSAPPTGELAELVRAAWEAPYRYPGEPVVLSGRFQVDNPGTDDLWLGHRKVAGRFTLRGFRGTRWSSWEVAVEGRKLGDEERRQLGAVVEDRLRLFAGRDFGGRAPFERAFRGATLARDGAAIAVRGASVERVELAEGRPVRLVLSGGARRELQWKRLGKRWVPVRIATEGEELRYTWTDLGDGWLWPKRVEMHDVFPDWGPETIRFSRLEVQ